ncbi:MAG: hypothetical protein DRQ37_06800 [Gammaproteobacteria bacterium]|nr:MAG: hypothetical protein DRQ37_06800 [Gammaproteobacteria bacterium]
MDVSEHPNAAHVLHLAVARRLFLENGTLRYQEKTLGVTLENHHEAERKPVVYYLIRDHFTGKMYVELSFEVSLNYIVGFLDRAWADKSNRMAGNYSVQCDFRGRPQTLVVPEKIAARFPVLSELMQEEGCAVMHATRSFAVSAQFRDVREWDKRLAELAAELDDCDFGDMETLVNLSHLMSEQINRDGNLQVDGVVELAWKAGLA